MNTEELKLVLEAIGQIADGGTTAAIVWMLLHYIMPILHTLIFVVGLAYTAVYIVRAIIASQEWVQAARSVAKAYGAASAHLGDMNPADKQAIQNAIAAAPGRDRS